MSDKYTYLLILAGAFIVPLLFSFHPKIKFNKEWRAFWPANLVITLCFVIWDIYYTRLGVWGFNENYITGIKFFNLPLEEILFFICIPYSSVFTYHCFKLFFPQQVKFGKGTISFLIMALMLTWTILYFPRLYTSATAIFLLILLLLLELILRPKWLSAFYFMYLIILIPFFIVNGILTGTGPDAPIVWYDNTENIGRRILTIPVEDIFYGMLLLLLNTALFERFRRNTVAG